MSAMMATALTMVWVLVMSGSAVAQSTLNYPLRMSDQAPVLVWTPTPQISDTDKGYPAKAWNVTYNESSWASWTEGNSGKGKSAHTTSFVGASVTVSFIGTGVSFYGSIDDGHVEVSADGGGIYPFYDNISPLALVNGLEYGVHSVTLYTRGTPTTLVSISGVEVTTWIESPADNYARADGRDVLAVGNNGIQPEFVTSQYKSASDPTAPWETYLTMGTNNDDYPCVCSRATTASATITLPVNTTFVELWGTSGPTNAPYTVTVTPSPPHDYGSEFRRDSFNPWESHPTLLYFNALDPDLQYTVVLTNLGRDQDLCIHSARVYLSTATNDGPPPAPNDDPSVFPMPGDGSIPSPLPSGTLMGPPPTGTPTATGTSGATNSGSTDNGTGTNSDGGNGTGAGSNKKSSSAGPIAGGVVGGIVAIAAILAILFYRRRRKNRSYRPPSGGSGGGHDRPSSWVPFLAGTGGGSRGSRSKDRSFRSSNDDYESQDTSMQTFDATSCTPPGGDLGGAILTHDELGQLALPRMSSATYGSSSTSIPSAASLPPISERNSMASSESHETSEMSFGAAFSSFAEPERERPKPKLKTSPMTPTAIPIQRRQNLEPIATQTEYQLPAGWPSPPTSPPMSPLRSGPRPPPRNRPGSTSLSPPTSPFL